MSITPIAKIAIVLVIIITTTLWGVTMGQTGCTAAIMGLAPCVNYISGSSTTTPTSSCCSQLSSVVQSQPQCLCQVLSGQASSFGLTINQTQALSLPSACKVQTPPVSLCNSVNQPSGSPVGSPNASPADALSPTTTPSTVSSVPSKGASSKSSTGSTSDGIMTMISIPLTIFLLFITSTVAVNYH